MNRGALLLSISVALSACVSVQPLPDPRSVLRPGQRIVVAVYPSPGPWIIDATDSKAEAAAKISPVGFLMQSVQNEHILSVSKDLQQYMPRPHYALAVHDSLLSTLRTVMSTKTVQTTLEAGLTQGQLIDWNKASNQLDWRLHYYAPDPDQPAPRDYARALTLDDALVLDVNISYGTSATDDGNILPTMTAASRVYKGDTSRLVWEHEDEISDKTSSSTLAEFKLQPWELTHRLQQLSPALGTAVASSFVKAFLGESALATALSTSSASGITASPDGGGLVPASFFQNSSTSTVSISVSTETISISPPAISTITIPSASTETFSSPPAISSVSAAGPH
jgi:hypothetical protein